jgi:hypothetical protein
MPSPFRLRTLEPTHGQALSSILTYLRWHPLVAWAEQMNVGIDQTIDTRQDGTKRQRFVRYGFVGCSDIIGQLKDGRLLAVEVKVKRDKPSPEQAAFLEQVNQAAGVALIARSIEDVDAALRNSCTMQPPRNHTQTGTA